MYAFIVGWSIWILEFELELKVAVQLYACLSLRTNIMGNGNAVSLGGTSAT